MTIALKELYNREYDGKICIGFMYNIVEFAEARPRNLFRAEFERIDELSWRMRVVLPASHIAETQIYNVVYQVPTKSVPLTVVCGVGLRLLYCSLQEELQEKSVFVMTLGALTNESGLPL